MIHLLCQYRDFIVLMVFLIGAGYLATCGTAWIEERMR